MDRRKFIQMIAAGSIAATFDVEKLLWLPGEKKIFIPSPQIVNPSDISYIIAEELERMIPQIRKLFERDNTFFSYINWHTHKT